PYTISITNTGRVETRSMTVRDLVPETLDYVSSQPAAIVEGRQLTWTLGVLPAGQTHTIQLVLRSRGAAQVINCATVITADGLRAENCVTTQITQPQLKVAIAGPAAAVVNTPIVYQVTVSNPGTGPATNVLLSASFDQGLEHETKVNRVELPIGVLGAGE